MVPYYHAWTAFKVVAFARSCRNETKAAGEEITEERWLEVESKRLSAWLFLGFIFKVG